MKSNLTKIILLIACIIPNSDGFAAQMQAESYEPGVILYKLKDTSAISSKSSSNNFFVPAKKALAQQKLSNASRQPLFLKKFPTKSIENIFPETTTSALQKQSLETDKNAGLLKNIYRVELHNTADFDKALEECKQDARVEYCQPSFLSESFAFPQDLPNDPEYLNPTNKNQTIYNFHNINLQTWQKSLGEGVVVGVLDTPFLLDHEDLQDNIWINAKELPCYDWQKNGTQVCVDKNNDGTINLAELKAAGLGDTNADGIVELLDMFGSIFDDKIDHDGNGRVNDFLGWNFHNNKNKNYRADIGNYHGTAVSGIIGSVVNNKGSFGVSPAVNLMAVQVASDSSTGSSMGSDKQANAVKYAGDMGAQVINYSRGTRTINSEDLLLKEAVKYAINKGAVFVAAAGNKSENVENVSPADFDNVISVGALDLDGNKLSTSNFGAGITVWVMSNKITSASAISSDFYDSIGQTSAAAPVVAGAVALLMSKNIKEVPDANSPRRIQASEYKGLIQKTCRKTGVIDHGVEICALDALALVNVSAPILSPISPKNASVGELIQFGLSATENNPNDRVTGIKALRTTLPDGSVINGLPQGAELTAVNNATANFRWTPSVSLPDGEYKIEFQADNTMGLKDIQTAIINLAPPQQSGLAKLAVSYINIKSTNRQDSLIYVNDPLELVVKVDNKGTAPSSTTAMEICVNNQQGIYESGSSAVISGLAVAGRAYYEKKCTTISVPELSVGEVFEWKNLYWSVNASGVAARNYVSINPDVLKASNNRNGSPQTATIATTQSYTFMYETRNRGYLSGQVSQRPQPVFRGTLIQTIQAAGTVVSSRSFSESRASSIQVLGASSAQQSPAITTPVQRPNISAGRPSARPIVDP